jgi:CheY-like chemotaxis protein
MADESKALAALFPGPRRLIVTALFGEPGRWWPLAELAGRGGLQPRALRRYITQLRDGGLLREQKSPAAVQANCDSLVFVELRSLVRKLTTSYDGGETVLVVEDQPATAQITRILLESWGYRVLEAHNAAEAMCIFEQYAAEIRLLLSDVIMPGVSGPQLATCLLKDHPELRVVYMSGYPGDEWNGHDVGFLQKPFNPASLARVIRRELDRPMVMRRQMK